MLGPSDGSAVPGAEMRQVPRDGSAAQDFAFEDAGNDTFYIRNRRSNLYLTVQEDAPGSEARAVTLEVKHAPDSIPPVANRQKWALLPASARDRFLIESLAARGRVLQPVNITEPGPVVLDVNAPLPPVDSNEWTVNSPLLNAEPGP